MGYGFVFAYFVSLLSQTIIFPGAASEIASLNVFFALLGLVGGSLPDVDRWEQIGFSHRRTLHYVSGYGLLAILFTAIGYFAPRGFLVWIMGACCLFAAAWLHSFMDIFDGFWADDVNKGVYEHITKRWIRALNWIPFASVREWSLQSACAVPVIAFSPQLGSATGFVGTIVAAASFLVIWLFSTLYEFRRTVPKRLEMETRTLARMGLQVKHQRPKIP